MFGEPEPGRTTTRHAHPVWKVVLSSHGDVIVDGAPIGPGALVPPEHRHRCASTTAYLAVFLSPTRLPRRDALPTAPVALTSAQVARLLEHARATAFDEESFLGHLGHPGRRPRGDGPLVIAEQLVATGTIADSARAVGLSASRLRALARSELGVPLSRLRQWARLRRAVADLQRDHRTISTVAADAGYADHAHLTRNARDQLGRTPRSLRPPRATMSTREEGTPPSGAH